MKNILGFVLIFSFMIEPACGQKVSDTEKIKQEQQTANNLAVQDIDVETAKDMIDASMPNLVIMDVRTPKETAEGKISGALEIDFKSDQFASALDSLDKSKIYLLYCKSGSRSKNAAELLANKGFNHIYNMLGGFKAWQELQKE